MVYDYNCWFPSDGPLREWVAAHEPPKESRYIHYFCGCDLGKKRDPSTIAVIESRWAHGKPTFLVSYLKRFRLSMLYTDIASKLQSMDMQIRELAAKQEKEAVITYILDSTGLGGPICELVEEKLPLADIRRVYITGGINVNIAHDDPHEYHWPKNQLISGLLAAFDSGIIKLTRQSKEIDAVIDELSNFEIKISEEGRDSYNAAPSKHDDLVVALALAVAFASLDGDSSGPMIWGGG